MDRIERIKRKTARGSTIAVDHETIQWLVEEVEQLIILLERAEAALETYRDTDPYSENVLQSITDYRTKGERG